MGTMDYFSRKPYKIGGIGGATNVYLESPLQTVLVSTEIPLQSVLIESDPELKVVVISID